MTSTRRRGFSMSVNFKQLKSGDERIVQWPLSGWHLRQSEVCVDTWDSQTFVIVHETVRSLS